MLNAYFSPFCFLVDVRTVGGLSWRRENITFCPPKGFVLRHYIPIVTTDGRIEEGSVDVLSRVPARECSLGFLQLVLMPAPFIKRENEKEWASGFESVIDPFQGHV